MNSTTDKEPPTVMTFTVLAAATTADRLAASLAWNLIVAAVAVVATVRTIRVPADRWAYRSWSKWAAVAGAWWVTVHAGIVVLPVGAAAVIWHTRSLSRQKAEPAAPAVPFAEGSPEPTEESPA